MDTAYKMRGTRTVPNSRARSTAPSTLLPGCCNQLLLLLFIILILILIIIIIIILIIITIIT